ncbi:MAG: VCBS repeat-containing protein [candidate division Zixibacteria bacterium]|nr:VCBS repeat-containing protein [candidate division Zixibacteria bacterium]
MKQYSNYRIVLGLFSFLLATSPPALSAENFLIEAVWYGTPQWMSGRDNGYETFGGSIAKGVDFFGSNVVTDDYVPVEIEFETDTALWTLVQTFRRGPYSSAGVGTFPGRAWDISDPVNPRRLNLCIVEYDDGFGGLPDPNFKWDPDDSPSGKYEYLFVMNSSYDFSGTTYAGINILTGDPDVLYAWWPRVADGHTFLESLPASLFIYPRINLMAIQVNLAVHLQWLSLGTEPDNYKLFWGDSAADSLLAELSGVDTTYLHSGLTPGTDNFYQIKSFDSLDNEILISLETSVTIRQLAPVDSVFPASQEITAERQTDIVVKFDSTMDPATINSSTFRVFGRWSGPATGLFQFENGNRQVRFTPDEPFFAGEWITVSLSKGITTSDATPMATGYSWSFWAKSDYSSIVQTLDTVFTVRDSGEGHIQCYGAYAGDLNDDGFSDLTIINEISDDVRVALNDGTGSFSGFTTYPFSGNGVASPNEGGDFNGDGIIDLAVGATITDKLRILLGDGLGGFNSVVEYTGGLGMRGVTVMDIDGDGDDDIITSNISSNNISIFLNNGNGVFSTVIPVESGSSGEFACAAADANNDGIPDLFVGTQGSSEIVLLLGDGQGGLEFASKVAAMGRPWMLAVGDVNGDGNVDVVSANSTSNNAVVIFGNGLGGMSPAVIYSVPPFAIAIDLGDLDGDGDLDMVTSSYTGNIFRIFENDGSGNFINPLDYPASSTASCCILHDRNNDGILDFTGIDEIDDLVFLFTSSCCEGQRGDFNSDGTNANILDLTFLVDFIFRGSGDNGKCQLESDINGDGNQSDILDLTYLVDLIFRGGDPPADCP